MAFRSNISVPIPTKDILSWSFDDPIVFDEDKPLYIDVINPSRSISSRQARDIILKLVAGFHAAGLVKGDCVCVNSFNDIQYPMVVLGIIVAGGVFSGTNPSYTHYELCHHLKISRSKFVITEPEMLDNIVGAADECKIPHSNIWVFNVRQQLVPSGFRSWEQLLDHGSKNWVQFDGERTSKNTTAVRLFSSGTTGLPKAASISHYNLIALHTLVHEIDKRPYDVIHDTSGLLCLPMFHAACVPIAHISPLRSGHVSYVMRRFELQPLLKAYQTYKITDLRIVPTIVIAIIMSPITKNYSLRSVRYASCGAAPLGKEAQQKLRGLLAPGAVFSQMIRAVLDVCSQNVDGKLIDDSGMDISAYDIRGELCVRGPTIIQNYFDNPQADAESYDSHGFFKTGDIAYCDGKTKKWYIVDRKKELIKVRGFQVAPPEIKNVLLSHPQIIDAAVIGIKYASQPDIEHPRAYVVKRPGTRSVTLDEKSVLEYCAERLAKYKDLTGGVVFLDAIPKNASGKILKRELRDMANSEIESKQSKL